MVGSLTRSHLSSADDRTLAVRAADGDIRAFEVLIRRYGPLLRTYASRVLGSTDEIDDVVQETYIAAWRELPALEDSSKVKGWLIRIVTNKSLDRVRARARHDHALLNDQLIAAPAHGSPEQVVEIRSRDEALSRVVESLPENQRRCWVLRELAQYSYEDIAAELDLPASTVRGLLARARKTLIGQLEVWR